MELSCPLRTTCHVPEEKFPQKLCNKSFIDQACSVKMAGYWDIGLALFFCEFMDRNAGQYPPMLPEQAWSMTHTTELK